MTRVDQFLPGFAPHDAIGGDVLQTRRVLREAGIQSDIWAEDIHPPMDRQARPYRDYPAAPRADAVIYHASTSSPMAEFLAGRDEPLLLEYHNITPARFFARWEPVAAAGMEKARRQLRGLVDRAAGAMADSSFNRAELVEIGYADTTVVPILLDFDVYREAPDARTAARLEQARQQGGARWLFVGRVAPNKCQHDVIAAFAAYRHLFDPDATLTLVGGATSRLYWRALEQLSAELGVAGAVDLADSLSFPQLLAHYRGADVFVCLSEHEGFCIPVVEAMHFGIPVLAHAAGALPETVADAGLLLGDKDPVVVAGAAHRVLSDPDLRGTMVDAGRARIEALSLARTSQTLLDVVNDFLARGGPAGG